MTLTEIGKDDEKKKMAGPLKNSDTGFVCEDAYPKEASLKDTRGYPGKVNSVNGFIAKITKLCIAQGLSGRQYMFA